VRAPLIRGDFNDDGAVNATDVDLLWNVLGSAVPPAPALYDLTGDGLINIGDATELIRGILHTSMADTDLDGEVGIVDLGALANAYDGPGRFRDGDTDGNGLVDILDLGNLAEDYDKTFPVGGLVPEPTALMLLVGSGLALLRRRPAAASTSLRRPASPSSGLR